jgi:hypothetical protein
VELDVRFANSVHGLHVPDKVALLLGLVRAQAALKPRLDATLPFQVSLKGVLVFVQIQTSRTLVTF